MEVIKFLWGFGTFFRTFPSIAPSNGTIVKYSLPLPQKKGLQRSYKILIFWFSFPLLGWVSRLMWKTQYSANAYRNVRAQAERRKATCLRGKPGFVLLWDMFVTDLDFVPEIRVVPIMYCCFRNATIRSAGQQSEPTLDALHLRPSKLSFHLLWLKLSWIYSLELRKSCYLKREDHENVYLIRTFHSLTGGKQAAVL